MAVPNWTQKSDYNLATLQERVTTSVSLPLDPTVAGGSGFNPSNSSLSYPAQSALGNATTIDISIDHVDTYGAPQTTVYSTPAIRVPTIPSLANKLIPVVIIIHPQGSTGANMVNDWQNYLGDHIIVAPTKPGTEWNVIDEDTNKSPDIGMLRQLITRLKGYSNVDARRIKFLGINNGGLLVNRAIVEIDDVGIKEYATINAPLFDPMFRNGTFYFPSSEAITGNDATNYNTNSAVKQGKRILTIQSTDSDTNVATTNDMMPYVGGYVDPNNNIAPNYSTTPVTWLGAQETAYQWAKSQGYIGGVIPDAGGTFYGQYNTYYYSYLSGQVLHYKTSGGADYITTELWFREIVRSYFTYTESILSDVYLANGSTTSISLNTDVITLISGELPPGMRLKEGKIVGTPFEVSRDTEFKFVLRATNDDGVRDRTFKITVQGPDDPVWSTNAGLLPLGSGSATFILDSSIVDFQLEAIDADLPTGQTLEYYIGDGDGEIPPGLQLTTDGRLVGIVDPILAIDKNAGNGFYDSGQFDSYAFDFGLRSANGFESYYYDTKGYDDAIQTQSRKKLNRRYAFDVSVSDGDTIIKRSFEIFLVGDDFLRADNTVLQVASGVFKADNTYLRTPVWLTPADLGYKRANNYVTIFLDVFDPQATLGELTYVLLATNPDNSASTIPPGMVLDPTTGEIAGRVPYQPAVTKEYQFTINAQRFTSIGQELIAEKKKTFTVKILGEVESTIKWTTLADLGAIKANFVSTFFVKALTSVTDSSLLYTLNSGRLPPGLKLNFDGEITGKVVQFATATNDGLSTIDNNKFTLDGGTTTIDRKFIFTVQARDRFGFSSTIRTFNIIVRDPDNLTYSNLYVKPLFKETQRQIYKNFIGDSNIFTPNSIYRPNDDQFGLQKNVKMLVYAGIETKEIKDYVAVSRKNHKRKRFNFGALKTAEAKEAGSNTVLYEVIYVDVNDPLEASKGTVAKNVSIANKKKITVDSVEFETRDDVTKEGAGEAVFQIRNSINQIINVRAFGNDLEIITRSGSVTYDANGTIEITTKNGTVVSAGQIATTSSDPFRFRPNYNTLKVDSDAVQISNPNDTNRFISNVTNMRENVRQSGVTEGSFLPIWMSTAQGTGVQELGYVTAVPLCYCKPGTAAQILLNITNSGFDFKNLDFEIDRYIVDATTGNSNEQYIAFGNYQYNV